MIRASLKSLLARKVRLLMSTFAIVLGVAFVVGSLVFSDTLNRSFTALFASTVGDVVVRPEGGTTVNGQPSTKTIPASVVARLRTLPDAARVDGNVSAVGAFVVGTDGKVVGGFGPPALGGNWTGAPAGHDLPGLQILRGRPPHGPDQVVLDDRTAERGGYALGDRVRMITSGRLSLGPRLVGVAGFPQGGSLNGATLALFDTPTAQRLFLHGRDAFNDLWVTARDGVSEEQLRQQVDAALPARYAVVTGDTAADQSASDLLQAVSFLTTFLLIFAGISLVVGAFLIVNTFSILVAQRSRELALLRALGASRRQVIGSVQLEALVLGLLGSTAGLGLGVLLAVGIRALFARFGLDLSGQALVFGPRTVLAAYAVGVVVTMAAAWLPARRTGRLAPVQALRDDVAMPESSLHRRLLLGLALLGAGVVTLGAGLFADVPHAGWFVGAGVLAVLLGVSSASPVISRPFLLRCARHLRPAVRQRRQPRRPERAAPPPSYDGHRVGPDDRADPGLHDGDRRRLREVLGGPVGRRRTSSATTSSATSSGAVSPPGSPTGWRGCPAWPTWCASATASAPATARTRASPPPAPGARRRSACG